ncbi:MAG: hypothetical protein RL172_1326 [Bacteroidota bacterium]|jgi:hypothetical protein
MKKVTVFLAAAMLLASSVVFAADNNETRVSSKVKTAFKKDFASANNISWQITNGVFIALFEVNNTQAEAAYNSEGELVALSKQLNSSDLPLTITLAISKKYSGYQVAKKATEITYDKETSYYINIGNDKEVLKLKCSAEGNISIDKKTKK